MHQQCTAECNVPVLHLSVVKNIKYEGANKKWKVSLLNQCPVASWPFISLQTSQGRPVCSHPAAPTSVCMAGHLSKSRYHTYHTSKQLLRAIRKLASILQHFLYCRCSVETKVWGCHKRRSTSQIHHVYLQWSRCPRCKFNH